MYGPRCRRPGPHGALVARYAGRLDGAKPTPSLLWPESVPCGGHSRSPADRRNPRCRRHLCWSGREDSNLRPLAPEASAQSLQGNDLRAPGSACFACVASFATVGLLLAYFVPLAAHRARTRPWRGERAGNRPASGRFSRACDVGSMPLPTRQAPRSGRMSRAAGPLRRAHRVPDRPAQSPSLRRQFADRELHVERVGRRSPQLSAAAH